MRELMSPSIPFPDVGQMKAKIMTESVRLFALKGYESVSIREIAGAVKVNTKVIYKYFPNKLHIMESIMASCEREIYSFYEMLGRLSEEAETFSQLLNNLFAETKGEVNPFSFYAIYCAMVNQFTLDCCRHLYYDVYFQEGHMVMRRQLETAIRRGLVEPFHVPEVASAITDCFAAMITFNVGRMSGFFQDFDPALWYERHIDLIMRITQSQSPVAAQADENSGKTGP